MSFLDDDEWTTGIGYYSEDASFVAIHELAKFEKNYHRTEPGTDIYVMCVHNISNLKDEMIKDVLLEFLVSIVKNKLIVKVQDELITTKTLSKYMNSLNASENKDIKNLLEYYHLLTSPDSKIHRIELDSKKYGAKYGIADGECTLYLREGESLNRKILITRKAGMRIYEQDRISGSIEAFDNILQSETILPLNHDNMDIPLKHL